MEGTVLYDTPMVQHCLHAAASDVLMVLAAL